MSKSNPFSVLKTMPARATGRIEPEETTEPTEVEQSTDLAESETSTSNQPAAFSIQSAPEITVPVIRPTSAKANREKRTTRIDPAVYDSVERELKRQKRARIRASSTLSDLLDELLRKWLNSHGAKIE